ncbi:MAG: DUF4145 domain-containing protein [Syntrophobacteraceae bacterium]
MKKKHVLPSIGETAFNCPHCGALASQRWFNTYTEELEDGDIPFIPDTDFLARVQKGEEYKSAEEEVKKRWLEDMAKRMEGLPFFKRNGSYGSTQVANLSISQCFNCKKLAVWLHDKLLSPPELHGEEPNADLPEDILRDYEEASSILNLSPRGAAALLRLAIHKLCKHLGESGENLNDDIASLVEKGLSPTIQKSLDVVRVIGNEAVHPGTLDLHDNRDVASRLFRLVNLIADRMITHPKQVNEIYDSLPASKKEQIQKRDAKKS